MDRRGTDSRRSVCRRGLAVCALEQFLPKDKVVVCRPPGQTLQIKDNIIYLDGKPNPEPENVQYAYEVTFVQDIPQEMKKELGITDELFIHRANAS